MINMLNVEYNKMSGIAKVRDIKLYGLVKASLMNEELM